MCKVLRTFQQSFKQNNADANKGVFQFPRYMKTNHTQYFRIKVLTVQAFRESGVTRFDSSLYIDDFPVITMNCNYQDNNDNISNRFYLGNLHGTAFVEAPTMIVEDLPMSPFTIKRTHSDSTTDEFLVVFQIELMEPN